MSEKEPALTVNNMIAFLNEKGLYDECLNYCKPLYEKQEKDKQAKLDAVPIVARKFYWEGHYTRCCYEMSAENFYDTAPWGEFVWDMGLLPFNYNDPTDPQTDEPIDTATITTVKLKDLKCFDKIRKRMHDFVDGNLDYEVERCHDFDKYGFYNEPTDEQLDEWLGNLEVDSTEFDDNYDAKDCFRGRSF